MNQDNYPTPHWCFERLEPFIDSKLVINFLEPCYGDARIIEWAKTKFTAFIYGYELQHKTDYLSSICPKDSISLIITNPPYSKALQFIQKGISESTCSFWLLRLGFLASQKRYEFFKVNPPKALIILSRRPSFKHELGLKTRATDNSDYAWVVWEKEGSEICRIKGMEWMI